MTFDAASVRRTAWARCRDLPRRARRAVGVTPRASAASVVLSPSQCDQEEGLALGRCQSGQRTSELLAGGLGVDRSSTAPQSTPASRSMVVRG